MTLPLYKTAYGVKWEKIFYHDLPKSSIFTYSEALECHETNKFSNLKKLGLKYQINEYFEFLLEYPEKNGYNRWIQRKNPLETSHSNTDSDTGFIPITLTWSHNFGGLQIHNQTGISFLDCDKTTDNNWYTIATYRHYKTSGYFPGPYSIVHIAVLYVRVQEACYCQKSKIKIQLIHILFILIH